MTVWVTFRLRFEECVAGWQYGSLSGYRFDECVAEWQCGSLSGYRFDNCVTGWQCGSLSGYRFDNCVTGWQCGSLSGYRFEEYVTAWQCEWCMQKRRQQWSVLSQRRTPMFPLFSFFFSSLFSLAASDCRMLLHICVWLCLLYVMYYHCVWFCIVMYTYICDCITGHALPLCVVTCIHAWPSILQVICYHCVWFCTCTHTYRSMWLSTLQVMCYHYVWFLYVRHGNCLPWVVGWVGWGALHPVVPCSTEVTACVIVYMWCTTQVQHSTIRLIELYPLPV